MAGISTRRFLGILTVLSVLIPTVCHALPGDLDNSGRVDGYDLVLFARAMGATNSDANWLAGADLDGNGAVDQADLAILSAHFGRTGAAFGVWAPIYEAYRYKTVRLAEDAQLLATSPALSASVAQFAGNPRDGTVWVLTSDRTILLLSPTNDTILKSIANTNASAIALNPDDQSLWVCDPVNDRVIRFAPSVPASYDLDTDTGHHQTYPGFGNPTALDVDGRTNTVWVIDGYDLIRLRGDAPDGYDLGSASGYHRRITPGFSPYLVRVNQGDSSVWLASSTRLQRLDPTGRTVLVDLAIFSQITSIAPNPMDGSVAVADRQRRTIRRIGPDGAVFFETAPLSDVQGVAVNPLDASMWVTDTSTDRIVHLAANGSKLTESAPLSGLGAPITLIPAGGDAARFPTALALADRTNIDVGQTVKFTGVGRDSDGTIIRYRWDFEGDGTFDVTATDSGITEHAYSSTGIFTPIFEVMDNDHLTAVDHRLVIRVGKLTAKATAGVTSGEAPLTVAFDGSFTDPLNGRVDSFQWDFDGDGIFDYYSDSSPKVSYTYTRQGTYTAILKVTDGPHSAIDSLTITVTRSAPRVTPYATPSSGPSPLAVDFSANALDPDGKVVLYQWDFEDDGTVDWTSVSSADATHVYDTPGTHTSRITVTDNDGQTSSDTVDITVSAPPPAPKATAAPDKGHAPLTVAFSASGSTAPAGTISKYEWDFGDCQILFRDDAENGTTNWQADAPWGTTTTVWRSSNHAFTDSPAGGYATDASVALTLKNPLDLSATTTATLSFWQRYSLGSYTSLVAEVSTDGGSSWNTLDNVVGSSLTQPAWTRISLDLSPYLPADQLLIRFRLAPGYYAQPGDGWYIDDIQIASCAESWTASADGTASHTYNTPGEFTARLRLTDSAGGQATATVPIQALPANTPLAALAASPTSGLAPLAVTLTPTVTASGTVTNYAWNFGGDILWTATTQRISRRWTLTGRELAALSADYISTMAVDPADGSLWFGDRNAGVIAHASPNGAQLAKWSLSTPLAIEVDGDSIWVLQQTSLRRFRKDGAPLASIFGLRTYTANMSLDQGAGLLWVWLSSPRQLIRLDTAAPDGYDVSTAKGHHQAITGFSDLSAITVAPDHTVWLADASTKEVIHLAQDGTTLAKIKGFSGPRDIATAQSKVWIATSSQIVILDPTAADGYDISTDTGSHTTVTGFSDIKRLVVDATTDTVWALDPGTQRLVHLAADGSTARTLPLPDNQTSFLAVLSRGSGNETQTTTADPVSHTFTTPGINPVRLTITDSNGRTAVAETDISVATAPTTALRALPATGAAPLAVTLAPTVTDRDGVPSRLAWDFDNDGTVDLTTTSTNPVQHTYNAAGTHTAKLQVTDNDGNTAAATVQVTVSQTPPEVTLAASPPMGYAPLAVQFEATATDPDGTVASIAWDLDGDGATDATTATVSHTFTTAGTKTVTVTVTDDDGNTTQQNLTVEVLAADTPWPVLQVFPHTATTGEAVTFCAGGVDPNDTITGAELDFDGDGTFDQSAAAPFTVLADDFELPAGGWTAEPPWTRSTESASSGSSAYTDSEGGDYANGVDASLTSPAIDLSAASAPRLRFRHRYALLSGDTGYVEISTDNGTTWTRLASYSNGSKDWHATEIDLRRYAGQATVKIRFRLVTNASDTADGWHIDDVFVGDCVQFTPTAAGILTPVLRLTDAAGNQASRPASLRVDHPKAATRLWVADTSNHLVREYREDGKELRRISGFSAPRMVTQDPVTGTIWVADTGNDRVVRLDAAVQDGYRADATNTADSSPSGAGGALLGDAAYATGKLNGGVQFDGNGDSIQILDRPAFHTPSFTIEAWVYPTAASGVDVVAGKVSQGKDFALVLNSGVPAALVYDRGRRYVQPADPLPLNQWSHLAMTYDNNAGQVTLYVNGGQVAQADWRADSSNTDVFTIGRSSCCGEYFTGTIDEVRFWNTVRSQAEINSAKDSELTGSEAGLIGYWRLNSAPGGITKVSGFNDPYFIAIAADHSVWVSDYYNHQVVHLAADGSQELARIDGFTSPRGITVAKDGTVWVADYGARQIVQLDAAGTELQRLGGFSSPITVRGQTGTGAIWLTDYGAGEAIRLGADGSEEMRHGGLGNPVGLDVVQATGEAWVTDYTNGQVILLDQQGNELLRRSGLSRPHHLAVDQQDGSAWVADINNNRVVQIMRDGTVRQALTGLYRPLQVSVIQPTDGDPTLTPPTATATATPNSGDAPLTVTFTATATDDGSITEYAWDFDGDGTFDATGANQSHTYTEPGVYHVILRVRDNDGLYGYDASATVRVTPFVIKAVASPSTGTVPFNITFDGALVSLPAGRRVIAWQWDFDNDGAIDFTSTDSPRHTQRMTTAGTFSALLTAVDDQGNRAHARVTVVLDNAPPSASNYATPSSGDAPLLVNLKGAASDANGSVVLYRWDYDGDGIDDWISQQRDTWFLYSKPGTYETVFTAVDNDGATASAKRTVTVNDKQTPPTVSLTATPAKGQAPLSVSLAATATDPDGTITAWSWDLDGDGAPDADTAGPQSHTFTQPGSYQATVTVTDNDGQTATDTILITVQPTNAPTAHIQAAPLSGPLPLDVVFNGADSTASDGSSIVSYRWSFGDHKMWVSSAGQHKIYRYSGQTREAEYGGMYTPYAMARDTDGTIWVSDQNHNQVVKLAADSTTELLRLDGFYDPLGLALNPNDRTLWVADYNHSQVVHLDRNGNELGRFDGFNRPINLTVQPTDGSVWVADHVGNRLVHLAADGTWLAAVEGLSRPYQVVIYPGTGELWVSDRDKDRLLRLPANVPDGFHADQSNAVVAESVGGGLNALYNDAAGTVSGKLGGALTLDGNGDYVLLPASASLDVQSFTIEAWIKPAASSGEPAIFMRGNASGGNEIFFGLYNANTVSTVVNDVIYRFSGSADFLDGNWHHVALAFDQAAETLSCYVDGTLYGTPQNVTATLDFGNSRALIGADFDRFNGYPGNYFNGLIDEVRLWRTARSQAEIAAAMNTPLTGNETGLAAYWPLDKVTDLGILRITGLAYPTALALDAPRQRIWVCDEQLDAVIAFDTASGREVSRITGLPTPRTVAVEPTSGAVWVGDNATDTLQLFTPDGTLASSISGVTDPSDIIVVSDQLQTATATVRHSYPTVGTYLATLTVTDDSGLTDTDSLVIRAGLGPEAVPIAYPTTGAAPLTVRFVTNARGPEGTIENFAWDFDGDGTVDWSSPIPEVATHTYGAPGVYQATLKVTDNQGRSDTKAVTITATSPVATLTAEILAAPASGVAPLTSQLTGLVRATTAFVAKYEWDTDGDGAFDATGQTATVTLTNPGSRTVRLRVTDQDGKTAEATATVTAVAAGTPTASASASPSEGPASLEVTFSGSGADNDGTIAEYAWDFDGDGTFDHSAATPADVTHVYHTPGTYNALFRVTDNDGKTASVTVPVVVTAGITATLDRDQFDPSAGETITIASTLTGKATVTVRITDRNGNTLRTLVKDAVRSPGFYQDTWDGKDDAGKTVGSGVYLYLIDYTVDGITYHYDLTNSVGTDVDKITPQYPSVFNPFSAETNFFRYTLDTKSEVTIYMSPFAGGAQTRAKTLQLRSPRRAGSYVQSWDGTDDLGNLVKPMTYVIAVFAWPLPPNAIIVENRPVIGDLHVTPSTLNPAASPYDDATQASILFSLSKDATVTAQILDEDNYRVKTVTVNGKAGTGNAIVWDGSNEAGEFVAPGIYRVQITAEDSLGHRSEEANTVLIIFY